MFRNAVRIFTIDGFDIQIDPSWIIIAAFVTWSLSSGYFPEALPDASSMIYLAMAVLGMIGMFASLVTHELAHSIVARRFGIPIKSITLFVFGGLAEMDSEPASARSEFWIALAGPAMSIGLGIGFWGLAQLSQILGGFGLFELLSFLALVNFVLALFNLVPAFPMDGGRILRAYLWNQSGDILSATKMAALSGSFFGYALMLMGLVSLFQGALISGLWPIMIGAFVLMAARASYSAQLASAVFGNRDVASVMQTDVVTAAPDLTLSELVNHVMLARGVSFVPVVERHNLLGHIDRGVLSRIDRENWGRTLVGDVFVGLEDEANVSPKTPVSELLETIAATGRRKFLVVADRELAGVITLADLTRYLSLGDLTQTSFENRKTS